MIRNRIVRDFSGFFEAYWFVDTDYHKKEAYIDLRERMSISAIHDNGVFKAFRFSRDNNDIILSYIKIEDADIKSYPDMFEKRSKSRSICLCNRTDQSIQEYQDIQNSFLMYNEFEEIDDKVKHEFEDIKEECVKKHNAVYSSVDIDVNNIDIDKEHEIISIPYTYYYIKDDFIDKIDSEDVIFGEVPLPYGEWFIDYSGPWPADRPRRKENIALSKDVDEVKIMKRNSIVRNFLGYLRAFYFDTDSYKKVAYLDLSEKMCTQAIRDNGIFKTFRISKDNDNLILSYMKIEDKDIELHPDKFGTRSYFKLIYPCDKQPNQGGLYNPYNSLEFQDIMRSCLLYNETNEIVDTLNREFEKIKKEYVEKYNAVYSTVNIDDIEINKEHEIISIHFSYHYIKDEFINKIDSYESIFGEGPLSYGLPSYDELFNSDSQSTDEPEKDKIALSKDVVKALKEDKGAYAWCRAAICPERYYTAKELSKLKDPEKYYTAKVLKELKENNNMKMHLLIVPKGTNEEFVNNTKESLQSSNTNTVYVSSNDIAFKPNDKYKTKYDLIEYWIDAGMIYTVEFMVGYENDPETKALEAYIRGTKSSAACRVILMYQKDNIEKVVNNLRNDYVESSEVNNKLHNITDSIMDKVNFFKEFGLEQADLVKIRNANCDKDACFAAVLKMTDIAFASDNKKGSKGNKK